MDGNVTVFNTINDLYNAGYCLIEYGINAKKQHFLYKEKEYVADYGKLPLYKVKLAESVLHLPKIEDVCKYAE